MCNVYLLCEQLGPVDTHGHENLTYDLEKLSLPLLQFRLSPRGIEIYHSTEQLHFSSTEVRLCKFDIINVLSLLSCRSTNLSSQLSSL